MNKIITGIIGLVAVTALIISLAAVGGNSQPDTFGREGTSFPRGVSVGEGLGNGCYQIYATSSATVGRLVASTTATIEGVDGVMMFQYGSCL